MVEVLEEAWRGLGVETVTKISGSLVASRIAGATDTNDTSS